MIPGCPLNILNNIHMSQNMDKACLCSDCREACIKVEVSGLPDTCPQMVGPFQLVTLVLLIVFLVELIVIPVCFYCAQRSKHDGPEKGLFLII